MKEKLVYDLAHINSVVQKLVPLLHKYRIITFTGPLGVGKTTIIREILRACGVIDPVVSPTFTYFTTYENQFGQRYYHFDLYRIQNINEFKMAGFDEYLHMPGSFVLIEWPEIIQSLLPPDVCQVVIDYHKEPQKRSMQLSCLEKD
jgi:tRNA threonylcarbamoyladenosine biosynthesis protein TsaE